MSMTFNAIYLELQTKILPGNFINIFYANDVFAMSLQVNIVYGIDCTW